MRRFLRIVGIVAVLVGLLWVGQGTGVFPYPAESFMINQTPWIIRGAGLMVVGIVVLLGARRPRAPRRR